MATKAKQPVAVPDPRAIFRLAEGFRDAADVLNSHDVREKTHATSESPTYDSAAMLVVDALAVELYLKCLYVLDHKREPPFKHPFDVLFYKLTSETQSAVRRRFDINNNHIVLRLFRQENPSAPPLFDFAAFLKVASDTFTRMRYAYEATNKLPKGWFFWSGPRDALRDTILIRYTVSELWGKPGRTE